MLPTLATPFPKTTLEEVMGCLAYQGSPKTLEEMEAAIQQGVEASWYGDS
ncbi:hypothetical protein [Acaryochloris sp. CCMEE 5410]|nr:hypothetical protein [Acaryochloris sp. CCMEE 5410]